MCCRYITLFNSTAIAVGSRLDKFNNSASERKMGITFINYYPVLTIVMKEKGEIVCFCYFFSDVLKGLFQHYSASI